MQKSPFIGGDDCLLEIGFHTFNKVEDKWGLNKGKNSQPLSKKEIKSYVLKEN